MQTGTGTFDVMPGILYGGALGPWSWGLSYRARLPLGVNPEGYMWGNYQEVNGWAGYTWFPGFTTTARANFNVQSPDRGRRWVDHRQDPGRRSKFLWRQAHRIVWRRVTGRKAPRLSGRRACSSKAEFPSTRTSTDRNSRKPGKPRRRCAGRSTTSPRPPPRPIFSRKGPQAFSASPVASWNGLYLGLNGGYTWNGDTATRFNYAGSGGGFVALAAAGALPSGFNLTNNGFMGGRPTRLQLSTLRKTPRRL